MKKEAVAIIVVVIIIVGLGLISTLNSKKVVDWTESFDERSNKPYGLSVLYKELPRLFKDNDIKTVYHTPYYYLSANSEDGYGDHIAEGTYMIIGGTNYLDESSVDELLYFAENGNTLFISDYYFPSVLMDSLGVKVNYAANKDSISSYQLRHQKNTKTISIDRNSNASYFEMLPVKANVLGTLKTNDSVSKQPNFIEIPFGDGFVYLHLEPKVFTNYNLLKGDTYTYVEETLSYLPDETVYFDSATKYYDYYYGETEAKSDLGWFLKQPAFKWAWLFGLLLLFLFIIFNAKRKQRIVEIIKPLTNTTVDFVKTISNLYYETQDHKNLVHKKITYFLERIRSEYHLDTSVLDEEFIERLAMKSGKKKSQVKTLVNVINRMQKKTEFFEDNLKELNKHIEDFYSA